MNQYPNRLLIKKSTNIPSELAMDVKGKVLHNSSTMIQSEEEEDMDLRRGPWTVDEDLALINYIANHGEGRWNSLARSSGLNRTGKSCRLRWLNYLRPDVRRGNITLEEQLLILELHARWGNRWSKIAQYLPGRTDNEIKNYWRTRVQKHAKQLKCDVNSKQFKDAMRYLWMPRLMERIQAATAATTTTTGSSTISVTPNVITTNNTTYNNNVEVHSGGNMMLSSPAIINNNNFGCSQIKQSYTPENSSTGTSSDSIGTHDYYSVPFGSNNNSNPNLDYYKHSHQLNYLDCITSPSGLFSPEMDFQAMEPNTHLINQNGDISNNLWSFENMLQQFNHNM